MHFTKPPPKYPKNAIFDAFCPVFVAKSSPQLIDFQHIAQNSRISLQNLRF